MNQVTLGIIIEKYRKKYNLRQQNVCKGICDRSTFLRVESGEQEVDFVVQETLLARLGQDAVDYEVVLDDDAYDAWTMRLAIRSNLAGRWYDVLQKLVEEYRRAFAGRHKLHEQFCLYYEMKLVQWRGEEGACELAQKALAITKQIEEMPEIRKNLYTPMEMDLLLTLIQHKYGCWNDLWQCRACLSGILEYAEVYFSKEQREAVEGAAWMELLQVEEKYSSPERLLVYIDRAITCFAGGDGILRMAEVRFFKAKFLYKISSTSVDRETLIKQCKEECMLAYNIYDVMECVAEREVVEHFCKEELQWHITTQTKWLD